MAAGKIDYLYLTPEQQAVSDLLNHAIDRVERETGLVGGLKCQRPETRYDKERGKFYDYYPHTDYDERTPPTRSQAQRMCSGCPVFAECKLWAEVTHPPIGVYAGVVYIDGLPET